MHRNSRRQSAARFRPGRTSRRQAVSYQFVGFTSAGPGDGDGINTLGFRSAPDLDQVLAATSFIVDTVTGALLESDIFFNSEFPWSTSASGAAGRVDVESIALHETGHLSGLGHSMIGETELQANGGRRVIAAEAVMFPIAVRRRQHGRPDTARADDIAGISDLYPDGNLSGGFRKPVGSRHQERQRRVWCTRCRLQLGQRGDDREFLVGHRGSFLDCRSFSRSVCGSCRTHRRCRGGQLFHGASEPTDVDFRAM